jgi:hypothetical protein
MCKIVYLTSKRFDKPSKKFKESLAKELRERKIEVVTDYSYDFLNWFRKHKTYGVALTFDFYRDGKQGCGLTLNKNCSFIGRDFAYNLSNDLDSLTPTIHWRDFKFVDSDDKEWFKFFNKISASTKAIFYLCTYDNVSDKEIFYTKFNEIIKVFADEIVRIMRSDYDAENYRKRVKLAKNKVIKTKQF